MFEGLGHTVSAGAAQWEVQHYNLICSNESSDTHHEDQVPGEDIREIFVGGQTQTVWIEAKQTSRGQQRGHADSLSN